MKIVSLEDNFIGYHYIDRFAAKYEIFRAFCICQPNKKPHGNNYVLRLLNEIQFLNLEL